MDLQPPSFNLNLHDCFWSVCKLKNGKLWSDIQQKFGRQSNTFEKMGAQSAALVKTGDGTLSTQGGGENREMTCFEWIWLRLHFGFRIWWKGTISPWDRQIGRGPPRGSSPCWFCRPLMKTCITPLSPPQTSCNCILSSAHLCACVFNCYIRYSLFMHHRPSSLEGTPGLAAPRPAII